MRLLLIALLTIALAACSNAPRSEGEKSSGYTYIPLDPLAVEVLPGEGCAADPKLVVQKPADGRRFVKTLLALPDNAVRVAIREYDTKNQVSFGNSAVGLEGRRYQVVLDYINVDSANIPFDIALEFVRKWQPFQVLRGAPETEVRVLQVERRSPLPPTAALPLSSAPLTSTTPAHAAQAPASARSIPDPNGEWRMTQSRVIIPVYVGVGLRLTADLQVLRGTLNISSLGGIAAAVESGRASGSLVVQTLGITGRQVSTSLPLPSELNQTTIQNAILALGSIKAIVATDENSTIITPRVTGIYLPFGNATEELVNKIVSELAKEPIPWKKRCEVVPGSAQ